MHQKFVFIFWLNKAKKYIPSASYPQLTLLKQIIHSFLSGNKLEGASGHLKFVSKLRSIISFLNYYFIRLQGF